MTAPEHQFITLDWEALLSSGGLFGLTTFVITCLSLWYAWKADKRRKKAEKDKSDLYRQLLITQARQEFEHMADMAGELSTAVNGSQWTKAERNVGPLNRKLAQGNGSFAPLISELNMKPQFEVAMSNVRAIATTIPPPDPQNLGAATHDAMKEQCVLVSAVLDEICGKLKFKPFEPEV